MLEGKHRQCHAKWGQSRLRSCLAPLGTVPILLMFLRIDKHERKRIMTWLAFVAVSIVCWGLYGPVLHSGQVALGVSPMRALLCVGLAYFLIGILIP